MNDTKGPLIAVDMDDVLAMTNANVVEWHNRNHGSDMTLNDCHYYHYWKNAHWGTREETLNKLSVYHRSDDFRNLKPVPYAAEGLAGLKSLGFRLVIITARSHEYADVTHAWIEENLPGVFEDVICTAMFAKGSPDAAEENPWAGKSKVEVIKSLGAVLLIDDALENAIICAAAGIHVLLFGDYPWSKRHSRLLTPHDLMSREQRIQAGDDKYWEREVVTELPPGIRRVGGWQDVIEWVKEEGKEIFGGRPPLEDLEALGEDLRA
ncbi:hypothetical protein FRC04_005049 [Tulasnella sp. 424]|nr:hypothetical protein FRC04_005049 [Tulasnella sp. 424]